MNSLHHDLQQSLPETHILRKLYDEHGIILSVLESMESAAVKLRDISKIDDAASTLKDMQNGVKNLLAAEPHHQREEQILFPQMENQGISGPPSVMRMEHETLREKKHHLQKLLSEKQTVDFQIFRENISNTAYSIVELLRAHIHKENMILYPMAFRAIQGDAIWQEMAERSDRIGNCKFNI
ncbi:MAG: hemerythrin domain-containing protein [Fidelibacterota bacterium]